MAFNREEHIPFSQACTDPSLKNPNASFFFDNRQQACLSVTSSADNRGTGVGYPRPDVGQGAASTIPACTVFISYFPDPLWPLPGPEVEHDPIGTRKQRVSAQQACVMELVRFLQTNGVRCVVDMLVEDDPPEDWSEWLEEQVLGSDFVLMVMTPAYSHFFKRGKVPEKMSEVTTHPDLFEVQGQIFYNLLQRPDPARGNQRQKFVPIFLNERRRSQELVPLVLQGASSYALPLPLNLDGNSDDQGDLVKLYSRLTKQNRTPRPPLGKITVLPPVRRHIPVSTTVSAAEPSTGIRDPSFATGTRTNIPTLTSSQTVSDQPDYQRVMSPAEVESIAWQRWQANGGQSGLYKTHVSELFLQELSDRLGNLWKALAGRLGVNTVEVENIIADHQGQREQAFQSLVLWKQSDNHANYRRLCEAFVRLNRVAMIRTVIEILALPEI